MTLFMPFNIHIYSVAIRHLHHTMHSFEHTHVMCDITFHTFDHFKCSTRHAVFACIITTTVKLPKIRQRDVRACVLI